MSTNCTQYLLVPDRSAARQIRRALARDGSRLGVTVGTWPEFLGHAGQAYLLPAREEQWELRLEEAMASIPDAFWARSSEVARGETVSAIGRAFTDLMNALEPGAALDPAGETRLPRRAGQHLADLSRLHTALDGALPDELATIRDLLAAPAADAIRRLRVYRQPELPSLNRWQTALIHKLNGDAGEPPDGTVVPGWRAFEDDVSAQAMVLIEKRLADLERGRVRLNRVGDEALFTKVAGLTPYALDNSPLIALFALPDDAEVLE